MKITGNDIKILIFAGVILAAQYLIFKPSTVEVQVEQDERFNNYLLKDNERLNREKQQLVTDYEILQNEILQDSNFINSVNKDSLRNIANRYNLH